MRAWAYANESSFWSCWIHFTNLCRWNMLEPSLPQATRPPGHQVMSLVRFQYVPWRPKMQRAARLPSWWTVWCASCGARWRSSPSKPRVMLRVMRSARLRRLRRLRSSPGSGCRWRLRRTYGPWSRAPGSCTWPEARWRWGDHLLGTQLGGSVVAGEVAAAIWRSHWGHQWERLASRQSPGAICWIRRAIQELAKILQHLSHWS